MNLVSKTATPIEQTDLSAIDFEVEKKPMFSWRNNQSETARSDPSMRKFRRTQGVYENVRTDIDASMGVVGKNYVASNYAPRWDMVLKSIRELGKDGLLNLEKAVANFQVFENGRKLKCEISLPSEKIEPVVGDISEFRIIGYDSHDMSWQWGLSYMAFRWWCENGCADNSFKVNWVKRHTAQIKNDENQSIIMSRLTACIKQFRENEKRFERWAKTPATAEEAKEVFQKTLAKYNGENRRPMVSKLKMEDLTRKLYKNTMETGWTVWAVYQAATEWATYAESKGKSYNSEKDRHRQISKMIQSNAWKTMSGDEINV